MSDSNFNKNGVTDIDKTGSSPDRASWSGKWSFILAAAASAVGLGNFWRFPYLAAKYGGGTFLILNFIFVFTVGISLLLLEVAFGRITGLSVIDAFKRLGEKYTWIGYLTASVPFIIGTYYFVVGGWVCKYVYAYFVTDPSVLADGGEFFNSFQHNGIDSTFWLLVFLAITFIVVSLGVNNGIEKANLVMMPTLIIVAVLVALYIAFQPGSAQGLAYYFIPDFSVMSPELIVNALGQTFYSLSIAMGIMITYGSYLKRGESLTSSVTRIGGFSFSVSLLAGLIIVPAAFMALGHAPTSAGPSLMFVTLPQVFGSMGFAAAPIGVLFFVLVLFAALTSSISVAETCVSIIVDTFKVTRAKSLIICCVYMLAGSLVVNSGYNIFSNVSILGMDFLSFVDFLSNSIVMPVVALLTCIVIGWLVTPRFLVIEIELSGYFRLKNVWLFMIKYVCPILILVILISNIITMIFI